MRAETWVSLGACLIGATLPLRRIAPHAAEQPRLLPAAGMVVLPFVLVAGTGWATRADRHAARVVAAVSMLVLVVGLSGWSWAVMDREGNALILTALLFVPAAQLLIWLGGAVISGRRGHMAKPTS